MYDQHQILFYRLHKTNLLFLFKSSKIKARNYNAYEIIYLEGRWNTKKLQKFLI